MKTNVDEYEIDEDRSRLDFDRVQTWLSETYWSPGVLQEKVEQAARHSYMVVGAYLNDEQVGYMRVVSDCTRFAYLADVFVDPAHRRKGIGRGLVKFALEHPDLIDVRSWLLSTTDAHGLYRDIGFSELRTPDYWMQLIRSW